MKHVDIWVVREGRRVRAADAARRRELGLRPRPIGLLYRKFGLAPLLLYKDWPGMEWVKLESGEYCRLSLLNKGDLA
jgi:hypothetical protein